MLFSTFEFIFGFLPVVLAGYFLVNHFLPLAASKVWLAAASLVFYAWWNPVYLPLLLGSIVFNYGVSMYLIRLTAGGNPVWRKTVFIMGVLANVGLLGYFKYANFFVDTLNVFIEPDFLIARIILPLGVSFFTIQQIAYLVDVYEGLVEDKAFVDYGLFVTFFPHLLAGPILHHQQMIPQFAQLKRRSFDAHNFSAGAFLFAIGLFKKVIIADSIAVWVDRSYDLASDMSVLDAWVAMIGYTLQLYFDFSGYVDMALGMALMVNIKLPRNFDSPLLSHSVMNFWERWHITLSKFITTYIYTPLVRYTPGRITFAKSMVAMFIAMFISGLWHGADWHYIWFGVLHGVGLIVNHSWRRTKRKVPFWLAWAMTFVFINMTLAIFRAPYLGKTWQIWTSAFGFGESTGPWHELHGVFLPDLGWLSISWDGAGPWAAHMLAGTVLGSLFLVCVFCRNSGVLTERFKPTILHMVATVVLFVPPLFMLNRVTEFVYFQF